MIKTINAIKNIKGFKFLEKIDLESGNATVFFMQFSSESKSLKKLENGHLLNQKVSVSPKKNVEISTVDDSQYNYPMGPMEISTVYDSKSGQKEKLDSFMSGLIASGNKKVSYGKHSPLTIVLDSEFKDTGKGTRKMVSYQAGFYIDGVEYGALFIPNNENRVTMYEIIGSILDFLRSRGHDICSVSNRQYRNYLKEQALYDKGIVKNEPKIARTYIGILTHFGRADLSGLERFRNVYDPLNDIVEVQGGTISTGYTYKSKLSANNSRIYALAINYSDTMGHAIGNDRKLDTLGKTVGFHKIPMEKYWIENMDLLLDKNPEKFIEYAMYDIRVPHHYIEKIYGGKNIMLPMTLSSGFAKLFRKSLQEKLGCVTNEDFQQIFQGLKTTEITTNIDDDESIPQLRRQSLEPVNSETRQAMNIAIPAYCGGLNACYSRGYVKEPCYDYDLPAAYPTAMSTIPDIDFNGQFYIEHENFATLESFQALVTEERVHPYFAFVDFEFPKGVIPSIPIRHPNGLIYPLQGTDVPCTGLEILTALMLGAKVFVRTGILVPTFDTMSIQETFKEFIEMRGMAADEYGKGSTWELLIKTGNNSVYGKMAQGISEKKAFIPKTREMEEVGYSSITCPIRAATATAFVRCLLILACNRIKESGKYVHSVTTDGMISDITEDELKRIDLTPFSTVYMNTAKRINPEINKLWEIKHSMPDGFFNVTTRGNIAPNVGGVLARNSFKVDYENLGFEKKSFEERQYLIMSILSMDSKNPMVYNDIDFTTIKQMVSDRKDFTVQRRTVINKMAFDYKNKPVGYRDETVIFNGVEYKALFHKAIPYDNIDEFIAYKHSAKDYQATPDSVKGVITSAKDCEIIEFRGVNRYLGGDGTSVLKDIGRTKAIACLRDFLKNESLQERFIGYGKVGRKGVLKVLNDVCKPEKPLTIMDYDNNKKKRLINNKYAKEIYMKEYLEFIRRLMAI